MSEHHFSFRKGTHSDIDTLESIRKKSIQSCSIYSDQQLAIWSKSVPNWSKLIEHTIVCTVHATPVGFVIATPSELDLIYLDPDYHGFGIANTLVSMVETDGMRCDCNPYSEKVLVQRGWSFQSHNIKEKDGETFRNKWYVYQS